MLFYGYNQNLELGSESCGTNGKYMFAAKSLQSAKRTIKYKSLCKNKEYRLYTYTNFYDYSTFKRVL